MTSILPPNATNLERAVDGVFAQAIEAIPENSIYDQWSPQTCPAELLGYLAWAVSVDDWNPDWSEDTKRNVIAGSLEVHQHKGTLSSVKRVLEALGVSTQVKEYPATPVPHTIEAIAYANQPLSGNTVLLDANTIATVRRNLEFAKPARTTVSLKVGAAFQSAINAASIARFGSINRINASIQSATRAAENVFTLACAAHVQPLLRASS